MFPKAKIKRFNEEIGCAPPPTAYDPKIKGKNGAAVTLDKSDRWQKNKEITPGPGAYKPEANTSPGKKRSTSSSRLDSSTCSNASSSSSTGTFLSPPKPNALARSSSTRSMRSRLEETRIAELQEQLRQLTEERDSLKSIIYQLREQVDQMKKKLGVDEAVMTDNKSSKESESERCTKEESAINTEDLVDGAGSLKIGTVTGETDDEVSFLRIKVESTMKELVDAQTVICKLTDERSGLQLRLKELEEASEHKSLTDEEVQNMKDHLDHLTTLRDNLEASVLVKDDLVAELQLQLDEMVIEARESHEKMELYKSKMEVLEEELQSSFYDRNDVENKVKNMVAKYEALMKEQSEEQKRTHEILAKKDIEIELLNGSLSNLNMKVSEYEQTISSLQAEVSQRKNKMSILETTISDLSMMTKEKEVMESMLEEELNHRTEEVSKLEQSLHEVELKLEEVAKEKEMVAAALLAEKKLTAELNERINLLETQIKEKEVLQQFLEKEITSREAEVSESCSKVKELESDLSTARQVATDLQQEAEAQLNQLLTLKSTISAKDCDIDAKEELINTLKEELSQKFDETSVLQEKVDNHCSTNVKMEGILEKKNDQILKLDEELILVKEALVSREESLKSLEKKASQLEDNNYQLEEKVVELMAEISDREAEHINRVKSLEGEVDEVGIKYSESLLEHDATRRALAHTAEELEKENLLRLASEEDVKGLKEESSKFKEEYASMETNLKDLVQKYTNLEDALACEEAENRDLEDRLEREMKVAQEAASTAEKEISDLKTSNTGFCTQITQLKIDMRKKSQAVEEMHQCIEALREEKQHLTALRDNLEATVETKEETIAQLHLQMSMKEREMEEERVTLRSLISDLENHWKEAEIEISNKQKLIKTLEEKLTLLEEEKSELKKAHEKQLEEKLLSESETNAKYEDYEDQLKALQTSLTEKTKEVEEWQEKYANALANQSDEMKALDTSMSRLRREIDTLNSSLMAKDTMMDTLNSTLAAKSEEVQSLYKSLEEKQTSLVNAEGRLQDLEEKEEKLTKEKAAADVTISGLQDSLNTTKHHLSRLEIVYKEEKEAEMSRLTTTYEGELEELQNINETLKEKLQNLEKMIEPFREQLDAYEVEKASLLSRSSAAKEEVDKLSKQYATLLGHQNHKQKIQHVLKLKTENNELREEVHKLRQETERQRKNVRRLEEKLSRLSGSTSRLHDTSKLIGDKENSFFSSSAGPTHVSTPLKPSNKPHRI